MEPKKPGIKLLLRLLSYILVATLASSATLFFNNKNENTKLSQLRYLIQNQYVGEVTDVQLDDGAATGMVAATGDRWSYYIPASQYAAHMEQVNNEYVGIGVTIGSQPGELGYEVLSVESGGGAEAAGMQAGDIIVTVAGQRMVALGIDETRNLIRGEESTSVEIVVNRKGEELTFQVQRKKIKTVVASGTMLQGNVGRVTIKNFDERCADETLAAIKELVDRGATALIFDVRNNPGGFKKELVQILDYLLPAGPIFRSVSNTGEESVTESDENCLEMPMAVLINSNSYSAAELFAAALSEYEWAVVVGEATTGKNHYQNTFRLSDGSAVNISVGKYTTPKKNISLAEAGGLKPDIPVPVEEEMKSQIYAGKLPPEEDPQIQAAIKELKQD